MNTIGMKIYFPEEQIWPESVDRLWHSAFRGIKLARQSKLQEASYQALNELRLRAAFFKALQVSHWLSLLLGFNIWDCYERHFVVPYDA